MLIDVQVKLIAILLDCSVVIYISFVVINAHGIFPLKYPLNVDLIKGVYSDSW